MAFMALWGCKESKEAYCIMPSNCELHTGDVVFRRGCGLTSQTVIKLDEKGQYSHVGIVVDSSGVKMIVHAVPDEPDFEGDIDRVKMDTPEQFFSSVYAQQGEVCRTSDSVAARQAADAAMEVYRRHTLFDHGYNDSDTTRMYCTELVVHAYHKAGVELVGTERQQVDLPFLKMECMFPSDILESDYLKSTYKFNDKN